MPLGKPHPRFLCIECGDPIEGDDVALFNHACLNCDEDFQTRLDAYELGAEDLDLEVWDDMPSVSYH